MFRNIKTVKHMKINASWWMAFINQIQNISNHSPLINQLERLASEHKGIIMSLIFNSCEPIYLQIN